MKVPIAASIQILKCIVGGVFRGSIPRPLGQFARFLPLTQRCIWIITHIICVIIVVGLYLYRHTTPEIGVWKSIKRGFEFLEKGF